ncbi:hypothetical protein [Streptomyces sp. URMC 124]|uniref:hypothetical protein n=1 Tax=Streptomyces sp. URMC 124 TaxID=3423405 RepID=UPI003F1AFC32
MTRHPEPNPHDQAMHHWLTQHQHTLTHALDDLLDVEAGLREVLLHSHHDTATANLDTVLDTEAGLAAILPATPQTPLAPTHGPPHHHIDTAELLRTLTPAERLALRNHPNVKAAGQALVRALTSARDLDQVLDLASLYGRAVGLALDLAHDLARALDPSRALDHDLDRALTRARACARALARDRACELESALAREIARARNFVRDHARYLEIDRARSRARARFLALALARARDLDLALALALELARDGDLDFGLIFDIRTAEVGRAIGMALHQEPPALDKDSLDALLDDFTTADLSNANLTGIDLSGIRWSEHTTQWPSTNDIEDLKARSDETPPGSGTWVVRSGTTTIRNLAEW